MGSTAQYSTKIFLLHLSWPTGRCHNTDPHTSILDLSAPTWDPLWGASWIPNQLTCKGCLCPRNQGTLGSRRKGAHGSTSGARYSLTWCWDTSRVFVSGTWEVPQGPQFTCSMCYFPSWEQPSGGWIIEIVDILLNKKHGTCHLAPKQKILPVWIF